MTIFSFQRCSHCMHGFGVRYEWIIDGANLLTVKIAKLNTRSLISVIILARVSCTILVLFGTLILQ